MTVVSTTILGYLVNTGGFLRVAISDDGRIVAAVEQVSGGDVSKWNLDINVTDTVTGLTRSVRQSLDPALRSAQASLPELSGDGRYLVFTLTPAGEAAPSSVMRLDLVSGELRTVSVAADGTAANGASLMPSVSKDGRYIAFESRASNLVAGDTNGFADIFVKDMQTGTMTRLAKNMDGEQWRNDSARPVISDDGHVLVFTAYSGLPGTHDPMFAQNLLTGELKVVSQDADMNNIHESMGADVSADGRYVSFQTTSHLMTPSYVYRKDLHTGELLQVSVANSSIFEIEGTSISADGQMIAFARSEAVTDPYPRHHIPQIFVKDIAAGTLTQVSKGPYYGAEAHAMSSDGQHFVLVNKELQAGSPEQPRPPNALVQASLYSDSNAALAASAGAQLFMAHAGDQQVFGGAAVDAVAYRGSVRDYTVLRSGDMMQVIDSQAGRDGSDLLTGIERLHFNDGSLAFDSDGHAGQAYRLYQAALDRVPDTGGLSYWMAQLDKGMPLDRAADNFVKSTEFTGLYGKDQSNGQLVERMYQNVLHRPGDAAGVAYWTDVLDRHAGTVGQVLAGFSESAENVASLVGVFDHGVAFYYFAY